MRTVLVAFLLPIVALCQQPYGLSQLDNYARLANSGNLGGLGQIQQAVANGQVRSLADLDGSSKLSGLPPLPPTDDEVRKQLSTTPAPTTTRATAKPTTATTPSGPIVVGPYAVNPVPELPPQPEDRQKGRFDDDGNFVPAEDEEKKQTGNNKIQGTRIHHPRKLAKRTDDIEDYEPEDFYDDPTLHVGAQKKPASAIKTTVTRIQQRPAPALAHQSALPRNPAAVHNTAAVHLPQQVQPTRRPSATPAQHQPRPLPPQPRQPQFAQPLPVQQPQQQQQAQSAPQSQSAFQNSAQARPNFQQQALVQQQSQLAQQQFVRQVPQIQQAPVTQPPQPPRPQYPSFMYRPRPKAYDREPYFDNVLQEVEEYDDFLEQHRLYREQYPYSPAVVNPYDQLHPGQLLPPLYQRGVTIDNTGYVKPLENHEYIGSYDGKTPVQTPQQQAQPQQQTQSYYQQSQQQQQQFNTPNLFTQHPQTNTATEHPLLNLLRIFELRPQNTQFNGLFPHWG